MVWVPDIWNWFDGLSLAYLSIKTTAKARGVFHSPTPFAHIFFPLADQTGV